MAVIPVELAGRGYEVRVTGGLLANIAQEARAFIRKPHVCIVADANARAHWGESLARSLSSADIEARWYDGSGRSVEELEQSERNSRLVN